MFPLKLTRKVWIHQKRKNCTVSLTKLTEKEILEAISPVKQNAEKQDESVDSKLTVPPSVIADDITYFTRSRAREKPV